MPQYIPPRYQPRRVLTYAEWLVERNSQNGKNPYQEDRQAPTEQAQSGGMDYQKLLTSLA